MPRGVSDTKAVKQTNKSNGKHLLLIANPKGSGSDTDVSRKITCLLNSIEREINKKNPAS